MNKLEINAVKQEEKLDPFTTIFAIFKRNYNPALKDCYVRKAVLAETNMPVNVF